MDKLKQKSIKDYDIWELHCKYIGSNKMKRRLKKKFCRQARKRLKEGKEYE